MIHTPINSIDAHLVNRSEPLSKSRGVLSLQDIELVKIIN